MGSYTSLLVDEYEIVSSKSYADLAAMTVFRETDKYLRVVKISDGTRIVLDRPVPSDFEIDEDDEQIEIGYSTSGRAVLDRLEVMVFTLPATRAAFERGIAERLERLRSWQEQKWEGLWSNDINILEELSFDRWLSTFRSVKNKGATRYSIGDSWEVLGLSAPVNVDRYEEFLVSDQYYYFQFPLVDIRFLLRAVLESCGVGVTFSQDLQDVVAGGYYWYEDPIAENASAQLKADFPINSRIIVLTEGVTDKRALEGALRLLYPHLVDYFGFLDFEGASIAGGAGPLVATVKAFAGAGVANRAIAFFDNDAAARAAVRSLQRIALPESIRIVHYPSLPLGEAYPTVGPSGAATMNVNGLAASIELYFGEDVLRNDNGELTPVVWRSYENSIASYHGELADKPTLQRRFEDKLRRAIADPQLACTMDWSGIRLILSSLIGAFDNVPASILDD